MVESSKRGQSLKEVAAAENMEKVVDARMSDKRFKEERGRAHSAQLILSNMTKQRQKLSFPDDDGREDVARHEGRLRPRQERESRRVLLRHGLVLISVVLHVILKGFNSLF